MPIVTPLAGEVSRLIQSSNSGLIYDENISDSCFNALLVISNNLVIRLALTKNALDLFSEKFSGSKVYGEFVMHMERIASIEIEK
jgi:hypothetical protein